MRPSKIAVAAVAAATLTVLAGCSADTTTAEADDTFSYALITPGSAGDGGYFLKTTQYYMWIYNNLHIL